MEKSVEDSEQAVKTNTPRKMAKTQVHLNVAFSLFEFEMVSEYFIYNCLVKR